MTQILGGATKGCLKHKGLQQNLRQNLHIAGATSNWTLLQVAQCVWFLDDIND